MMINAARCTNVIKSRIAMEQHSIGRRFFTCKFDFNLRKKLAKCCSWNIALYGAETWTLRKLNQKFLESFEQWCWRRMEKITWTDRRSIT
jgi:hypothetical protein